MGREARPSGAANALPHSDVVSKRGPIRAFQMQKRTACAMRLAGFLPGLHPTTPTLWRKAPLDPAGWRRVAP